MANYFKDYVKENGLLTDEQFKKVMDDSMRSRSGTFYSSLLKSGFIEEEVVIREACTFFGCITLEDAFHTKIDFDRTFKVVHLIEQVINRRQFAVLLDEEGDNFGYVIPDPEQDSVKSAAMTAFGSEPQYILITTEQFEIFSQFQLKPKQNEIRSADIVTKDAGSKGLKKMAPGQLLSDLEATAAQKLLDALIECAIERRASDLHIRAMGRNRNAQVKLRVDGVMQDYTEIQSNALENLRNLLKTKCKVGGEKPNAPVEGQIVVIHDGKEIDTRVNIVRSVGGYDFVLRFIRSHARGLAELGLNHENLDTHRLLMDQTKGLVIVCGPTGSGKTTLLYAGLLEKMDEGKVIYTMEDPVEITVPGIVQNSVIKEQGQTYEKMFPSALRHDPDIIMIGEIRELDVAKNCIQASDTGHLVLSTLHANDAASAITRLINIGVDPYALGDVLVGIVAQRLVRRVCPDCKEEYWLDPEHPWRKFFNLGSGPIKLARGKGCAKCSGTGYFDRIAINEIILVTPEIRDAIQVRAPRSVIEAALQGTQFKSYIKDGVQKALAGITTLDELVEYQKDILSSFRHNTEHE